MLFLAVFCLFSVMGLFNDLMNLGKAPYIIVAINAVASGCVALIYVLIATRYRYYWFIVVSVLQIPFWIAFGLLVNFLMTRFHLEEVPSSQGIRVMGVAILVLVIMSYSLFIGFISRQGADAYRVRNELELAHGIQKTLVPPVTLGQSVLKSMAFQSPATKSAAIWSMRSNYQRRCHRLPRGYSRTRPAGWNSDGHAEDRGRTALLEASELEPAQTLPLLLERLNSVLPGVKEPHMYATFTGFRLGANGSVHYALAASPPILHWHAGQMQHFPISKKSSFRSACCRSGIRWPRMRRGSRRSVGGRYRWHSRSERQG